MALVLLCAGCAQVAVQDQHADSASRMRAIATRFDTVFKQSGMSGVIADIDSCYTSATALVVKEWALRDCLVLDHAAWRMDVILGRRLNGGPLPYFTDAAFSNRIVHYAKLDGFQSPQQLSRDLTDTEQLVMADINLLNAAPLVVDHSIPPLPGKRF